MARADRLILTGTVIFSLCLGLNARATEGRVAFPDGSTFPESVSLKNQFMTPPRKQVYGSCHVFAAVEAVRAACYRQTQKLTDFSEAYAFSEHLLAEVRNPESSSFLVDPKDGEFSNSDGGLYHDTLARLGAGHELLNSEFSMGALTQSLGRAVATRKEFERLSRSEQAAKREDYESRIRSELAKDLVEAVRAPVQNHRSSGCDLGGLRSVDFTPNPELAVALLTEGFPLICQFQERPKDPTSGSHVVIYGGYAHREELPNEVGFLVRDSTQMILFDTGWNFPCSGATVVFNSSEEERVQQLLQTFSGR